MSLSSSHNKTNNDRNSHNNLGTFRSAYANGALGSACHKTRLCMYFQDGYCSRGVACSFAHGEDELRSTPDLSRTKMCPRMLKLGECRLGERCQFAHDAGEIRLVREALPLRQSHALLAQWRRRGHVLPPRQKKSGQPAAVARTATSFAANFLPRSPVSSGTEAVGKRIAAWPYHTQPAPAPCSSASTNVTDGTQSMEIGLPSRCETDGSADYVEPPSSIDEADNTVQAEQNAWCLAESASELNGLVVVQDTFMFAASAGQMTEGARILHGASGLRLIVKNTFFDIDEDIAGQRPAEATPSRRRGFNGRARSANARLAC